MRLGHLAVSSLAIVAVLSGCAISPSGRSSDAPFPGTNTGAPATNSDSTRTQVWESYAVSGRVLGARTKRPIPGATVIVSQGSNTTTTGTDGSFTMTLWTLPGAVDRIAAVAQGYRPSREAIIDRARAGTFVDLLLTWDDEHYKPSDEIPGAMYERSPDGHTILTGRVVSSATGGGIPELTIAFAYVSMSGQRRTEADGRFRIDFGPERGEVYQMYFPSSQDPLKTFQVATLQGHVTDIGTIAITHR